MTRGIVKSFNSQKGFGFIGPDTGGKHVFALHLARRNCIVLTKLAVVRAMTGPVPSVGKGQLDLGSDTHLETLATLAQPDRAGAS